MNDEDFNEDFNEGFENINSEKKPKNIKVTEEDSNEKEPDIISNKDSNRKINKKDVNKIKSPNNKRKNLLTIFIIFVLLVAILYGLYYFLFLIHEEETDNAYVSGNIVNITSQVSGIVTQINADETQFLKAGDEVVKLDPLDAKVALSQVEAALGNTVRQLRQQYANVEQYSSLIKQRKIELKKAQDDYNRRLPLAKNKAISQEEIEHAKIALENAKAALVATEKQAETAKALVAGVSLLKHPSVLQAKANFVQSWIAFKRNAIVSPVTGYVAKRSVQVGSKIAPGTALLSVVPLDQLWIDANLKESQLKNIRIGQEAKIVADIYGKSVVYHGKVVGLSAGTGSAFSLLPAQNATGNWVKVVQRVPVRISLDKNELEEHPLRIGLSTTVKIDVSNTSGPMLSNNENRNIEYKTDVFSQSTAEAEKLADKIIAKNAGLK